MQGDRGGGGGLEHAIALYRGPFLAGFSLPESAEFETWVRAERRTCESLCLKALATLIEEQTARGEYAAAIAYAQRYLETDDLAEDVHRRLIELYAAIGDRGAALERELGISPLPETRAVYQTALRDPRFRPQYPLARPSWTTLPSLDAPLVGREEALNRLQQTYANAQSGRGGAILISGEAGVGKSRLMQEFAASVAGQALVLTGASQPGAQAVPYQSITQALRAALGRGDQETQRQDDDSPSPLLPSSLSPIWLAEAARLLPELRALYPDLPPPPTDEPQVEAARASDCRESLAAGLAALARLERQTGQPYAAGQWLLLHLPALRVASLPIGDAAMSQGAKRVKDARHPDSQFARRKKHG